ncbi:MAG: hypothetical protein K0Q95_3354 [Bacteroidota bacterium]|jgi:hypothetical protein|nr:hypothetical protein [Bacteroidota bacterium]
MKRFGKKIFILLFILSVSVNFSVEAQVEIVSSGPGSAYVLNVPAIFPLRNGVQVTFKANVACTTAPTINVTSTGSILIKKEGGSVNLAANDIKAGQVVTLVYDGSFWQMVSAIGNGAWSLTGNSGTTTGTNFIGTSDGKALMFKVNNQKSGYIDFGSPYNVALGYQTLLSNTSGSSNVAMGYTALLSNTIGVRNVGVGSNALYSNLGGADNNAVGFEAMFFNTSGNRNSAFGSDALNSNISGSNNVAMGYFSLYSNDIGNNNVSIGYQSMLNNYSTSNDNTAVGYQTFNGLSTGQKNIAIGSGAGVNVTTGSNNSFLGYNSGLASATQRTNATAIGYNAKVDADNALILGGTGIDAVNVGINTASPTERLDVAGNLKFSGALMPNNNAGLAGQVLTSQGPGIAPTWVASAGSISGSGTINYLARWTPNGTQLGIGATYDDGTNVGIGTNSPTSKLHVFGTDINIQNTAGNFKTGYTVKTALNEWFVGQFSTAALGFNITDIDAGNATRFTINQTGNVGIGTTSPQTKLHVAGDNPTSIINQVAENTSSSIQSGIITMRSRGTVATPVVVNSGDQLGGFYMMGYDGTGFGTNGPAAGIAAVAAQSFSVGTGTDLYFSTSNLFATSATTKMMIAADGNVGIGTTNTPNQKLEVQDGHILLSNTGTQTELRFKEALANGAQIVSFKAPAALAANVNYTLPIDDGNANDVLVSDGTGVLSWSAPATGVSNVTASSPLSSTGGTSPIISLSGIVPITNGGTNNSTPYTAGSVIFSNGTSLTQNNSRFFWDNTNLRLGVGTSTPAEKIQVVNNTASTDNSAVSVIGGTTGKASYFMGSSTNNYSGAIQYDNSNNSMNFWTNNTVNRLVITNGGNIGVGTATPTTKIHSRGDLQIEDPANSSGVTFNMATLGDGINPVNGTGTKGWQWLAYGNGNGTAAVQNDMRLTWYNGTGTAPFLYFDNTGKLGINMPNVTDQPVYDLDVAGTIRTGYAGRDGHLRIYSEQGATDFEASFSPPVAMTQNTAYLLPPDDGNANDVLTSNGSGTLAWTPVSSLGVSGTGTINYSARWTSSTQLGIGAIQDNGTNAGIGVAPTYGKLDVAGEILSIDGTSGQAFTIRRAGVHRWTLKETGAAGLQFMQIYNDAGTNLSVSRFDIADNGNIGIGTSTPAELLELSSIDSDVDVETYSATESSSLHIKRARGTAAVPSIPLSGDYFGGVGFQGWDGTAFREGARVQGVIDGSAAANDMPGRLEFHTSLDGTTTPVERMRISNTGNVGIGTSLPGSARLNVEIPSSDALNPIGLVVTNNYTGASTKYGIDVNVDGAGSGSKYGISSSVIGLAGDASSIYGYQVAMTPSGIGQAFGLYASMSAVGSGTRYGFYNTVSSLSTNASSIFGISSNATKPTGSSGNVTGAYFNTVNDGTGVGYGLHLNNTGTGTTRYGIFVSGETDNYLSSNLGIGVTAPAYQLQLTLNSAAKPTSNVWTVASDARLKSNVHPYEEGLAELMRIKPVWFTYTGEANMPKETGIGVIAQELQEVAPYMVKEWSFKPSDKEGILTGEEKKYLGVDNGAMTYMLINAIKEQQAQIEALKKELQAQKKLIEKK